MKNSTPSANRRKMSEFFPNPPDDTPVGENITRHINRIVKPDWAFSDGADGFKQSVLEIQSRFQGLPLRAVSIDGHSQVDSVFAAYDKTAVAAASIDQWDTIIGRASVGDPLILDGDTQASIYLYPERTFASAKTNLVYSLSRNGFRYRFGEAYGRTGGLLAVIAHYGERPNSFPTKRPPQAQGVIFTGTDPVSTVLRNIVIGRAGYSIVLTTGAAAGITWTLYGCVQQQISGALAQVSQKRIQLATGTNTELAYFGTTPFDAIELDVLDTALTANLRAQFNCWDE